jgi:hypothetical protein
MAMSARIPVRSNGGPTSQRPAYSLDFQACSGASIATVTAAQLRSVTARTALITVTVGGDDNGYFDSIIEACIVDSTLGSDSQCQSLVQHDKQSVEHVLGGPTGRYEHLFSTIGRIEGDFAKTAPGSRAAKLVVLDYPQPFSGGTGSSTRATLSSRAGFRP